jgi:hypothetical protein
VLNSGCIKRIMGTVLLASIAVLTTVAPASAHHPSGIFAKFAQCPFENPKVEVCTYAESTSGVFQVGKISVPIVKPDILQGGYYEDPEIGRLRFVDAANGETLVKVPQVVPGGLLAYVKEGRYPWYFRNFCKHFPNNPECKLTSTEELVGEPHINPGSLIFEEGVAVEEPVVLHLKNPLLGAKCFIGTPSEPIVVSLTTGVTSPPPPNAPIHGAAGHLEFMEEGTYIGLTGTTLVDNAFASPGANGCGGPQAIIIDKEMDEKDALPSPAGHNTVTLSGPQAVAVARTVEAHEEA